MRESCAKRHLLSGESLAPWLTSLPTPTHSIYTLDARRTFPFETALRRLVCVGALAITLVYTLIATVASQVNYPGGQALRDFHAKVHELEQQGRPPTKGGVNAILLHSHVSATMTGVVRFQLLHLHRPASLGALGRAEWPPAFPARAASPWPSRLLWMYDRREIKDASEMAELNHLERPWWIHFSHVLGDGRDGVWEWYKWARVRTPEGLRSFYKPMPGLDEVTGHEFQRVALRKQPVHAVLQGFRSVVLQERGARLLQRWTELLPVQVETRKKVFVSQNVNVA